MATFKKVVTSEDGLVFKKDAPTVAYGTIGTEFGSAGDFFGETIICRTAAGSSQAGKLMVCAGGTWALADNNTEAHGKGLLGVVTTTAGSSNHPADGYLIKGLVRVGSGLEGSGNVGDVVYIGDDGELVHTAPNASGEIVRPVGYIVHVANRVIYFNPDKTWVTLV